MFVTKLQRRKVLTAQQLTSRSELEQSFKVRSPRDGLPGRGVAVWSEWDLSSGSGRQLWNWSLSFPSWGRGADSVSDCRGAKEAHGDPAHGREPRPTVPKSPTHS